MRKKKSGSTSKQFEENEKILEEISETLRIRIGNFGELFGVVRQVSGEAIATLKNSLVSISIQEEEGLAELAETRNLPSIEQMKNLLVILLEEMTKSGNVERFDSEVILPGGSISDAEIVRVGVFNAITEDYFLKFIPETQSLQVLARQPAGRFRSMADDLFELEEDLQLWLSIQVKANSGSSHSDSGIGERINQGGFVGYLIILIGLLGVAMSLWRMKYLKRRGRCNQ